MPRRNLKFTQHEYYYIYNRGAGKHDLFIEEDNYFYVLRKTKKLIRELCLSVIAYCLMPNHYHFLIRQDGEISMSVSQIFSFLCHYGKIMRREALLSWRVEFDRER